MKHWCAHPHPLISAHTTSYKDKMNGRGGWEGEIKSSRQARRAVLKLTRKREVKQKGHDSTILEQQTKFKLSE